MSSKEHANVNSGLSEALKPIYNDAMKPISSSLALVGWGATVLTHARVITGSLSVTRVNGGRVQSDSMGRAIAIGSLVSLVPAGVLIARAAGSASSKRELLALRLLGIAFLGSTLPQLMGTEFERKFMTPTALALGMGCLGLGYKTSSSTTSNG